MRSFLRSLTALPIFDLGRHPDVVLATFVVSLVGMLIIPLPTGVLDVLLALNITMAALLLVATLFAHEVLSVSSYPTLLLITTLFRLGLNVSTTRQILTKGDAGEVVRAFGHFVLQGDLVVGMVIFLILTLVQFLVIAKGAERVAEVGARFTLDAMPGKQMSIDAALRAGALTEEQAQEKRDALGRESQLYGALDGAMKFVKGDAIAGLIITALNLGAGVVIGVLRQGLSAKDALDLFAVLSVGDGLVAQIPALLITLSAGILTTKVAPKDKHDSLGQSVKAELFNDPKVINIGGGLAIALALVPGLPAIPFLAIGGALLGVAAAKKKNAALLAASGPAGGEAKIGSFKQKLEEKVKEAKAQRAMADNVAPTVVALAIELDPILSDALGFEDGASADETEPLATLIPQLRDALYLDTGVRFPGVRVRSHVKSLPKMTFTIRLKDVPVLQDKIEVDRFLAIERPERLRRIGVEGAPAKHPLTGSPVAWIAPEHRSAAEASGLSVWSPAGVLTLHLAKVLKKNAKSFVGLQETSDQVTRLEKAFPALVKEVIPKAVTLPQLVDVLRRLVDEGVSIRDLKTIVEALGEHAPYENDGVVLTEAVRSALSLQIAHSHAGLAGRLPVLLLEPVIEESIRGAIRQTRGGSCLALEPELDRHIIHSVRHALRPVVQAGLRPVVLTNSDVRRFVRKLLEIDLPEVSVLSFEELPADLTIQPLGRVTLKEDRALAA